MGGMSDTALGRRGWWPRLQGDVFLTGSRQCRQRRWRRGGAKPRLRGPRRLRGGMRLAPCSSTGLSGVPESNEWAAVTSPGEAASTFGGWSSGKAASTFGGGRLGRQPQPSRAPAWEGNLHRRGMVVGEGNLHRRGVVVGEGSLHRWGWSSRKAAEWPAQSVCSRRKIVMDVSSGRRLGESRGIRPTRKKQRRIVRTTRW